MSAELREQIFQTLNLRETEDLLEIWEYNDRTEWSEITFEVIREILVQRQVEIPIQGEPVYEEDAEADSGNDNNVDLEAWEAKVLDNEAQPDFYDTLEVLDLRHKLNRIAQASIVVYALSGFFNLPLVLNLLTGRLPSTLEIMDLLLPTLLTLASYGLQIVITVFSLRALGSILRILMEMEFNSRRAK